MITEVELGFNQSDFYVIEGQTNTIDACVEITSGTLQRNISVHIDTINHDHGGIYDVFTLKLALYCHSFLLLQHFSVRITYTKL